MLTARVRSAYSAIVARYSPGSFLVAAVLVVALILVLEAFVLVHYFGVDVVSSLLYIPVDIRCLSSDTVHQAIGIHCFGDYYQVVGFTQHANPWTLRLGSNYPASGMLPAALFGLVGTLFHAPRVGLIAYLVFLIAALAVPAVWAGRGKPFATRVVLFGVFGLVSIPALITLDRGNAVGFAVPALLAVLVGLRRERYWVVVIAITIAVLVKPQFILLVFVLVAYRRWKHLLVTVGAVGLTSVLAYLAWPRDFPKTIFESAHNILSFGAGSDLDSTYPPNVSFAKGIHDVIMGFLRVFELPRTAPGYNVLGFDYVSTRVVALMVVLFITVIVVAGRRIPSVISAIVLICCGSLFSGYSASYYLVFALVVAAMLLRDPVQAEPDPVSWSDAFDSTTLTRWQKIALFIVVIATAASLTRLVELVRITVYLKGNATVDNLMLSTASFAPALWIVAIVVALGAWSFDSGARAERRALANSVDSDLSIRPREE